MCLFLFICNKYFKYGFHRKPSFIIRTCFHQIDAVNLPIVYLVLAFCHSFKYLGWRNVQRKLQWWIRLQPVSLFFEPNIFSSRRHYRFIFIFSRRPSTIVSTCLPRLSIKGRYEINTTYKVNKNPFRKILFSVRDWGREAHFLYFS